MATRCNHCGTLVMFTNDYCPSCRKSRVDGDAVGELHEQRGRDQAQAETTLPRATAVQRYWAKSWDSTVAVPFVLPLVFVGLLFMGEPDEYKIFLLAVIGVIIYGASFEASPLCGTIGKWMAGLRVTDVSGKRPTLLQALMRNGGCALGGWIPLLWGGEAWHDVLANTTVVNFRGLVKRLICPQCQRECGEHARFCPRCSHRFDPSIEDGNHVADG